MSGPTLSVIMINYNYGQYIEQAIQAILMQPVSPLEFLIIDDGSTDQSIDVIERNIEGIPYARLIKHEKNQGILATMEEAVHLAKGTFLYLASSDDYVEPDFLMKVSSFIEKHPSVGLCCSDASYFYNASGKKRVHHFFGMGTDARVIYPGELPQVIKKTNFSIASVTCVYRTDLIRQYGGFPKELKSICDWFLMYKIAFQHPIGYLPYPLGVTRIHNHSYSAGILQSYSLRNHLYRKLLEMIKAQEAHIQRGIEKSGLLLYIGRAFVLFLFSRPKYWKLLPRILMKKWRHLRFELS